MSTPEPRTQRRSAPLRRVMGLLAATGVLWNFALADDGSESTPRLGRPLAPATAASLPALIFPDGRGLPAGRGDAATGERLYQAQCASCHGKRGEGLSAPELVGGTGPLSDPEADKTLLTYWPYASTLFDTLRRSMPPASPGRLQAEELYALCAWLLSQNGLWDPAQPLDARGLAAIRMPNREGFLPPAQ